MAKRTRGLEEEPHPECAWCESSHVHSYIFPADFAGLNDETRCPYRFCSAECALAHVFHTYSPETYRLLQQAMRNQHGRSVCPSPHYINLKKRGLGGALECRQLHEVARVLLTEEETNLAEQEDAYAFGEELQPDCRRTRTSRANSEEDVAI